MLLLLLLHDRDMTRPLVLCSCSTTNQEQQQQWQWTTSGHRIIVVKCCCVQWCRCHIAAALCIAPPGAHVQVPLLLLLLLPCDYCCCSLRAMLQLLLLLLMLPLHSGTPLLQLQYQDNPQQEHRRELFRDIQWYGSSLWPEHSPYNSCFKKNSHTHSREGNCLRTCWD